MVRRMKRLERLAQSTETARVAAVHIMEADGVVQGLIREDVKRLEERVDAALAEHHRQLAEVKEQTDSRLHNLVANPMADLATELRLHEERLKYVESQVGDALQNQLVESFMNQKGLTVGDLQRVIRELPPRETLSKRDEMRLAQAKEILGEAAATARNVEAAGASMEKATAQAWIHSQMRQLISDMFGFGVYRDFENFLEAREFKMKQHAERADGKEHLAALAGFFEALGARLKISDLDPKADLPGSFAKYLERQH